MIQSTNELYRDKLGAADGEIGGIKDFYFDDQKWAIRYLVADTGNWLPGKQVLISPRAFGHVYQPGKVLFVNLTRKQIENCPPIETHQPVSRQYEERYFEYYGWPDYWQGDGLWGHSGFPMVTPPGVKLMNEEARPTGSKSVQKATHLRSTQAVKGYSLQGTDGIAGHVSDFLMDDRCWAIEYLVIKTGHRFTGKDVQISKDLVQRISYEDSTVFVDLTKAEVELSPPPVIGGGTAVAA